MYWNNAVNKVPTLLFYPAYKRSDSILFDDYYNPIDIGTTELITQESIIEFILFNTNNENTIKEFLLRNCFLDSKLCLNKFNLNELIMKKILRLNNNLVDVKVKKENFILNDDSKISNRSYYNEYINLLNGKYNEILQQIHLFQNFMF